MLGEIAAAVAAGPAVPVLSAFELLGRRVILRVHRVGEHAGALVAVLEVGRRELLDVVRVEAVVLEEWKCF